jgi:hypothetical protein
MIDERESEIGLENYDPYFRTPFPLFQIFFCFTLFTNEWMNHRDT